jgi:RimJ/RimL family protein N-acetyltransferase
MTLIPTLHTDRVILRAPTPDDLPAITAFFASAQSHMVGGPRDEMGAHQSLLAGVGHWDIYGYGSWVIADRQTNAWLGRTGFLFAPGWHEPELGWTLASAAQGKGIAFEATQTARTYGATHLGLDRPISYIRPTNARSIALAQRLGAQLEQTRDDFRGGPCQIWRHPATGTTP